MGTNPTKDTAARVTDATAERQFIAEQVEARNQNPLNVACRPGGYYLSSGAGIPTDCNGVVIPEAEWKPEDVARIKGTKLEAAVPGQGERPIPDKRGADVIEGSNSEHRAPRRAARPR